MTAAAQGESAIDFREARAALRLLTGGRIELFQRSERKAQRGWLQGRFRVRLLSSLIERTLGETCGIADTGAEVVIDRCLAYRAG